jgi:hypothetical protein
MYTCAMNCIRRAELACISGFILNRLFGLVQQFDTAEFQTGIAINPRNKFLMISYVSRYDILPKTNCL